MAISPDRAENMTKSLEVGELGYTLFSDSEMTAARAFGIAYQLGPTFSELSRLFILELNNGVWTILFEETYSGELTSLPWPLAVGDDVVVAVDSECLQVRDQPGLAAVPIDCLDDGTPVTINAGPTDRDGLTWWRLAALGWVAGNWLRYPAD